MSARIPALDLHFPSTADHPDLPGLAAAILDDIGIAAVHETGPEAAPVWRVFLADRAGLAAAAGRLGAELGRLGVHVEHVWVEDVDWAARSQAGLRRIAVGSLVVAPPWDIPDALDPLQHLVVIQPSTGFGTGHHETTRLCLTLLQDLDLAGRRVLDLGTGSGVLAIAAVRLGAAAVDGVDHDEDALAAARGNLVLNGVEARVTLRAADFRTAPPRPADVVLANLTGALLGAQARAIADLVAPGGVLVASGFVVGEAVAVASRFEEVGGRVAVTGEGDWAAFRALFPAVP